MPSPPSPNSIPPIHPLGGASPPGQARYSDIPLLKLKQETPLAFRVNKHRYPIIGYQGVINMVTEICNKFIDIRDETCEDRFFEMMR